MRRHSIFRNIIVARHFVNCSLFTLLFVAACAEYDDFIATDSLRTPIHIGSEYPATTTMTRATLDGSFVTGDEVGIFVVDRDEEGQPGTMMLHGNRASNIRFTLQDDGTWQAATQLYWSTKGQSADIYGYYPFDGYLASVTELPFAVETNQDSEATATTMAGYMASDLLWAKREQVEPTTETIIMQYQHITAGLTIRLERGEGFTAEEWADLDKDVFVSNTITSGKADLTTGLLSINDEAKPALIRPLNTNGGYRAVVLPQTVLAGKALLQIGIDGRDYNLTKNEVMTYAAGKMHQFTVTVDRSTVTGDYTVTLADEAIVAWVDEGDMHEGLVHQYVCVEVEQPGTLGQLLSQQVSDLTKVTNLKISGTINQDDMGFFWNNLPNITRVNLLKAVIEDGALNGIHVGFDIARHHPLESIIYPEKGLKEINGFVGCSLKGSLIIPEGVERLGWAAFSNNPLLTGIVSLPSTLKYADGIGGNMHGELILPEGLIEWGGIGGNYTGTMHLPQTLKKISGGQPVGLTGTINIPQGCEVCDFAFRGSQCTSLILPEGMTVIPHGCFMESNISGELVLPSTLKEIKSYAFTRSKINKIFFPDALTTMWDGNYNFEGIFTDCTHLTGTLTLPKNVARIPAGCFMGCFGISGLIIPKGTLVLDNNSFAGCSGIGSIVCEGEEPPVVIGDAFLGVAKDNFTVEVPKGCVEKYRNAPGWSEFKRIAEYRNFVCRPAQVQALNNVHQEELVLNADAAWTVADCPDWVTLSKTSGTGKTAITLTFAPLAHGTGNREGTITFAMGDYETTCWVRQYDYEYDEDSYLTLQTHTKGRRGGINIVFAGDGYDGASIADGSYLDLVRYQTECFFGIEPYKSMREYFNVYVTFPLSQEKGVNTMNTYVNNHFGTLYGMNALASIETTSTALITESDEVVDYVVNYTPVTEDNLWNTVIILVPNSTDYDGHTEYSRNNSSLCICPPSEQAYPRDTRGVIQHEAGGHGFGRLGDEMIMIKAFASPTVKGHIEDMHRQGCFANLATTGKLSSVPWAEFIFDPDYSDYVDVYEGGLGFMRGIYRPESNSCMNYGIPYYNTPSRLSIYQRILDYAGEEFRMEDFRAQDTFEWGATTITRAAAADMGNLTPITYGNHIEPLLVDFKRVGDEVRRIRKRLKEEWIRD